MNDLIIKEVSFNGANLVGILKEGKIYTPLKKFCEFLGVDFSSQLKRIKRDEVLGLGSTMVKMTTVENGVEKEREVTVLEISFLPLWLTGIKSQQCREEIRQNLLSFKLEAKEVLASAFFGKRKNEKISNNDWVFERITDNMEKAKVIEDEIEILMNKLTPLYKEISDVADLKKRIVGKTFFDFKN